MDLKNTVSILARSLEKYQPGLAGKVHAANVAEEPSDETLIGISLIKVEEETTLRNGVHHRIDQSFKTEYKNRPVWVNLYLLFSCLAGDYPTALSHLSQVIEFFQGNHFFTEKSGETDPVGNTEKFRIIMELQNLSMEQINHIWGFLGGKQKPSVLYKARLVPLEAKDKIAGTGEPILEINISEGAM